MKPILPKHDDVRDRPLFWMLWHVLGLAIVLAVVPSYEWGESIAAVQPAWLVQVFAMGTAYLALATIVALVQPVRTIRGALDVVLMGAGAYGAALVLLAIPSDVPVSARLVTLSMLLGISLTLLPILLQRWRAYGFLVPAALIVGSVLPTATWSARTPLQVVFGNSRSLSKVPFVIALDQEVYEKYGLNVSFWIPPAEGDTEIPASGFARPERPDILVDGHSPIMFRMVTEANFPAMIAVAGGDCMARMHIVGRRGLERLEDLKGKRLGVNRQRSTTAFVAHVLAHRMGWDPVRDISILEFGQEAESLRAGVVDAIVAQERAFAQLQAEGYPVLANSADWNVPMAGNSVLVDRDWFKAPGNRDTVLRFLKAAAEGFALFHRHRDLTRQVMTKWNGIMGADLGETIYGRGDSFPRKPYPCYDGVKRAMELYDSNEMRRHTPESFYDDSLMRELDESGFLDSLYE